MSTLLSPAIPVTGTFALVTIGATTYRWGTVDWRETGILGAGAKFWEGRLLSVGRLGHVLGNLRQVGRQHVGLLVANSDGAITPIVRDVSNANQGYTHASVAIYQVVHDPDDTSLNPAEIKQVGNFRIDAVEESDGNSVQFRLADRLENALGEMVTTHKIVSYMTAVKAVDGNANGWDYNLDWDVSEQRAPLAFGDEWVSGLSLNRLGDGTPKGQRGFWIFFVAKGGLTLPLASSYVKAFAAPKSTPEYQIFVGPQPKFTAQPTTGPVVYPNVPGGDGITISKTAVTVLGSTWQVVWGVVDFATLAATIDYLYNRPYMYAPGTTLQQKIDGATQNGIFLYQHYHHLITPAASGTNAGGLSEGTGYTRNPFDTIRAIAENYTEGSAAGVHAASFAAAKGSTGGFILPAAGTVSTPANAIEVVEAICRSHEIDVFWDWDGKLHAVDPFADSSTVAADHTFTEAEDIVEGSWRERTPDNGERGSLYTRLTLSGRKPYYFHLPDHYDMVDSLGVDLATVYGRRIVGEVDLSWTPGAVGAGRLAMHLAAGSLHGFQQREVQFTAGLRGLRLELGEWIRVTKRAGFDTGGYTSRLFRVTGLDFDPSNRTVQVTALLSDIHDADRSYKPYYLDNRSNWVRTSAGTITVAGGTTAVVGIGTSFLTSGVVANDVLVPSGGLPAAGVPQLRCAKVTGVTTELALTINQSISADTQMAITYRIERSHLTAPAGRAKYGRLALKATGQFSDAALGYRIY